MTKFNIAFLSLFIIGAAALTGCNTAGKSANGNGANNTAVANAQNGTVPGNGGNGGNNSGKPAVYPEMTANMMKTPMKGVDGESFTLSDHAGKVLLVNLWATWCGPCKFEMPELAKLDEEYKDKGLMIIGLDVEENDSAEMIKSVTDRLKINYKMAWINKDAEQGFVGISKMNGIPQSFLITRDGKLAGVFKGYNPQKTPADLRKKLDEVIGAEAQ